MPASFWATRHGSTRCPQCKRRRESGRLAEASEASPCFGGGWMALVVLQANANRVFLSGSEALFRNASATLGGGVSEVLAVKATDSLMWAFLILMKT